MLDVQVLEAIPAATYTCDADGLITSFNRQAEVLWGRKPRLNHPEDRYCGSLRLLDRVGRPIPHEQCWTARCIKEKRHFKGQEVVIERDDGSRSLGLAHALPILDDAGNVASAVNIIVDITQRQQAEAQLQQTQKMESIGRLAGGIAHDFNNILSIIAGRSEMLLEQVSPETPAHEDVVGIIEATARASALTGQLLAYSRREVIEETVLDLNDVLAGLETLLRPLIHARVDFRIRTHTHGCRVRAAPHKLEQVLINLVLNAQDAMPDGGEVTIELLESQSELGDPTSPVAHQGGPYAVIRVTDTGCGIDESIQNRIFEPFFTTKKADNGTGLGLSVAYGITQQFGGWIDVHSDGQDGSTFRIILPLEQSLEADRETATACCESPRAGTILLVEDEMELRHLLGRCLETCEYTVLTAGDGREALRVAGSYDGAIDLLISDMEMPRLGGYDLAAQLREQRPGMKILFISGYVNDLKSSETLRPEEYDFMAKPLRPSEVATRAQALLN